MNFSNRSLNIQDSPIRKFGPAVAQIKKDGVSVVNLNIGQPDIETPKEFFEAVRKYETKVLSYQDSRGMDQTIEATQNYWKKYGMEYEKAEIVITNGASEALTFAMNVLCDAGDAILSVEPFYTSYNGITQEHAIDVIAATTYAEDNFSIPPLKVWDELIETSGKKDKIRALLLSSPSNPTGRVYTDEEMQIIVDLVQKYDIWLLADEVYREFNYTDRPFRSFTEFEEISDRTILIDSVSKKYSACGARIGAMASHNAGFNSLALKMCQYRLCASTLDQVGAAAMDKVPDSWVEKNRKIYEKRRDALLSRLKKMDGLVVPEAEGAFYIVIKLPVEDADDFTMWTLKNVRVNGRTVLMTPAEAFYATPGLGKDEVRLSYCVSVEDIEDGMDVLEEALKTYPHIVTEK